VAILKDGDTLENFPKGTGSVWVIRSCSPYDDQGNKCNYKLHEVRGAKRKVMPLAFRVQLIHIRSRTTIERLPTMI